MSGLSLVNSVPPMSTIVNVHEAKTHLSRLLEDVAAGGEVVIAKAGKTVRQIRWFQVMEIRGAVKDTTVSAWQVTVKIGFRLQD